MGNSVSQFVGDDLYVSVLVDTHIGLSGSQTDANDEIKNVYL